MKKTAFLKKLLAITLSVAMLLSVLAGTISVSAEGTETETTTPTNILAGNTGSVYKVAYEVGHQVAYTPDYSTLKYDNLTVSGNSKEYSAYQVSLATLTDGDTSDTATIGYHDGGAAAIEFATANRIAIAYDLGGYYDLTGISIQQDPTTYAIYNYSVYAGDVLDATIFDNRIGTGGGVTEEISADLSGKCARYMVIVVDNAYAPNTTITNHYRYFAALKQIELYGEKTESIIEGKTAVLYNTLLETPYDNAAYFEQNYTNLSTPPSSRFRIDGDVTLLTTAGNTTMLKVATCDAGGATPLQYRIGIAYDLGGYYNLNKLSLTQELDGQSGTIRRLYNYSVYAGNTLDATIFENKVGAGGDPMVETTTVDLTCENSVRYVLIMFDHMSHVINVNQNSYFSYLTQIELYGEEVADVLAGNTTGAVYKVKHTVEHLTAYTPDYSTLKYDNLSASGSTSEYYAVKDGQATSLSIVTDSDTSDTAIVGYHKGGSTDFQTQYRIALAFDLGGFYNLDAIKILQTTTSYAIHNFSVYAGNSLDATIFDNRVGVGGGSSAEISTGLSAQNVRYVLIVIDNAYEANQARTNHNRYFAGLNQISIYGEKVPSLLSGNTTGALYSIPLANPLSHQGAFSIDYSVQNYTELNLLSANANSFGTQTQNGTEWVTGDPAVDLDLLTTDGNTSSVKIVDKPGNDWSLGYRSAIMYDLGAKYDLSTLELTADTSSRMIKNFSVYAGNTNDASILANFVGAGGNTTQNTANKLSVNVDDADAVQYVLIVFDNVTNIENVNAFGYQTYLSQIELYGAEATVVEETVYGDMNDDDKVNIIDCIRLKKALLGNIVIDSEIADLNGDGTVNSIDLVVLKKLLLGIEVIPPVNVETAEPNFDADGNGVEAF